MKELNLNPTYSCALPCKEERGAFDTPDRGTRCLVLANRRSTRRRPTTDRRRSINQSIDVSTFIFNCKNFNNTCSTAISENRIAIALISNSAIGHNRARTLCIEPYLLHRAASAADAAIKLSWTTCGPLFSSKFYRGPHSGFGPHFW